MSEVILLEPEILRRDTKKSLTRLHEILADYAQLIKAQNAVHALRLQEIREGRFSDVDPT